MAPKNAKRGLGKGLDALIAPAPASKNTVDAKPEEGQVVKVNITKVEPNRDQPRKVFDEDKLLELADSIKQYGIINPLIVQDRKDHYEIIGGERRWRAAKKAGLKEVPVIIMNLTEQEIAEYALIDNIQREDILPSEKAHAYRMKFDVMKHQGSAGGNTLEEIGEAAGECGRTVQRYIALSYLSDTLLRYVDTKKLPIRSGVELSYLTDSEQKWIEIFISEFKVVISPGKAAKIKMYSVNKELTEALLRKILISDDPKPVKVVLKADILSEYFPDEMPAETIEEFIIRLLDEWKEKGGQ